MLRHAVTSLQFLDGAADRVDQLLQAITLPHQHPAMPPQYRDAIAALVQDLGHGVQAHAELAEISGRSNWPRS